MERIELFTVGYDLQAKPVSIAVPDACANCDVYKERVAAHGLKFDGGVFAGMRGEADAITQLYAGPPDRAGDMRDGSCRTDLLEQLTETGGAPDIAARLQKVEHAIFRSGYDAERLRAQVAKLPPEGCPVLTPEKLPVVQRIAAAVLRKLNGNDTAAPRDCQLRNDVPPWAMVRLKASP
jgi:transposase